MVVLFVSVRLNVGVSLVPTMLGCIERNIIQQDNTCMSTIKPPPARNLRNLGFLFHVFLNMMVEGVPLLQRCSDSCRGPRGVKQLDLELHV